LQKNEVLDGIKKIQQSVDIGFVKVEGMLSELPTLIKANELLKNYYNVYIFDFWWIVFIVLNNSPYPIL
jgi:hypothetical protein